MKTTDNTNTTNLNNPTESIESTSAEPVLTAADARRYHAAIAEKDVSMENLHLLTKEEVLDSLMAKFVNVDDEQFQVVVIETVEEAEAYLQYITDLEATTSQTLITSDISDLERFVKRKALYNKNKDVSIAPTIFFSFLKTHLTETVASDLQQRLIKCKQVFDAAASSGLVALKENVRADLIYTALKQKAAASGYSKFVKLDTINKFLHLVRSKQDNHDTKGTKIAFFKPYMEFPRLMPDNVVAKVKEVQALGVFEELWVLYLDYTNDNLKTVATKIKDKDPILWGKLKKDSDELFYIIDWEDEYCNLNLESFVLRIHEIDSTYTLPEVNTPTPKELSVLFKEQQRQEAILARTNAGNYRELAARETSLSKRSYRAGLRLITQGLHLIEDYLKRFDKK